VLQGSIDTQKTLPFGSVEDVREEVRSRIRLFKDRGGFVLGPSQHLLSHVPLENIFAMYETAWEEGWIKSPISSFKKNRTSNENGNIKSGSACEL